MEGSAMTTSTVNTVTVRDEIAPAFQQGGFVRGRMGADTVNVVPLRNASWYASSRLPGPEPPDPDPAVWLRTMP